MSMAILYKLAIKRFQIHYRKSYGVLKTRQLLAVLITEPNVTTESEPKVIAD